MIVKYSHSFDLIEPPLNILLEFPLRIVKLFDKFHDLHTSNFSIC